MPKTCVVPACTSGYKSSKIKVSVFGFPSDNTLKKKWEHAIPRKNLKITKNSGVCELHFHDDMVVKQFSTIINGKTELLARERPKLNNSAVPCVFPNLPSYLSKPPQNKRKDPAKRVACTDRKTRKNVVLGKY